MGGGREIERIEVPDETTQRALDPLRQGVNELRQSLEGMGGTLGNLGAGQTKFQLVSDGDDIELADGVIVKLTHKLQQKMRGWLLVDFRGTGAVAGGWVVRVLDDGTTDADDTKDLWLKASGWGATITVRVMVF